MRGQHESACRLGRSLLYAFRSSAERIRVFVARSRHKHGVARNRCVDRYGILVQLGPLDEKIGAERGGEGRRMGGEGRVEAGASSPSHGPQGGQAKEAPGGGARGGRTGAREPRLAGAVAVMTRQG
jgi:hypothetical protein